jgi:hypothetical protein
VRPRPNWRDRASESVLDVARASQALVVEVVQQAVRVVPQRLVPVAVLDRATPLLDEGYELSLQLVSLHREFAHRLAETAERVSQTDQAPQDVGTANVVPLAYARGRSAHT